jgi:hypothetical protein
MRRCSGPTLAAFPLGLSDSEKRRKLSPTLCAKALFSEINQIV